MKISKTGYIFIITGIVIVLGYIVFAVVKFSGNDKKTVCNNLEIKFTDQDKVTLISQEEVARILDQKGLSPIGKRYADIRSQRIEYVLQQNPMIKNAECYKTISGTVKLEITQRTPKFIVTGNENYYVDTQRRALPFSVSYAAYLPVVSGRVTHSMAKGVIFDFVTYLESNPFWNAQIEQIFIRDDKTVELIPRVGDAVIYLGTFDDYQTKLDKLLKLYKKGFNTTGWNRYEQIDLQYNNQIVCTRRNPSQSESANDSIQSNNSNSSKKL